MSCLNVDINSEFFIILVNKLMLWRIYHDVIFSLDLYKACWHRFEYACICCAAVRKNAVSDLRS